jgi:hypothetical protein
VSLSVSPVISPILIALRIFDPKSEEAQQYFPSIQQGIWSLITILNASNWPDPIIPAFEDSQLYFLFFFSFLVVGSWGLLNASSGLVFTFFRLMPMSGHPSLTDLFPSPPPTCSQRSTATNSYRDHNGCIQPHLSSS